MWCGGSCLFFSFSNFTFKTIFGKQLPTCFSTLNSIHFPILIITCIKKIEGIFFYVFADLFHSYLNLSEKKSREKNSTVRSCMFFFVYIFLSCRSFKYYTTSKTFECHDVHLYHLKYSTRQVNDFNIFLTRFGVQLTCVYIIICNVCVEHC